MECSCTALRWSIMRAMGSTSSNVMLVGHWCYPLWFIWSLGKWHWFDCTSVSVNVTSISHVYIFLIVNLMNDDVDASLVFLDQPLSHASCGQH